MHRHRAESQPNDGEELMEVERYEWDEKWEVWEDEERESKEERTVTLTTAELEQAIVGRIRVDRWPRRW